jgi:ElaA protein
MSWTLRTWDELQRDELYAIMALRQRVFIVEQDCPYLDADGADAKAWHLWWTAADGNVRGYLRGFAPGIKFPEASLGRIVTAPEARGTGLGRKLVAEGIARITADGPVAVHIGAQKYLEHFYAGFGFVRCSDDYLEDGIPHLEMMRPA